jgi:OHCU decarboxylase
VTLDELNDLAMDAARRELERCCGSARWAAAMTARRPYSSMDNLQTAADEVWWSLDGADWLEAFSHHPRIGDRGRAAGWAREEQSGVGSAPDDTVKALAKLNRDYERKFGHVFLIFATGRSAEEILAELRVRLANDPAGELRNAAAEQAKITRLRLWKLLSNDGATPGNR